MFNSPVLDLVILLSFTYFVGSIMLTAINESIAAGLKTRAKDLKKTMRNLLIDKDWSAFVNDKIFTSQHIKSLMNDKEHFPSYIPAQNFILSVIEQIKAVNYNKENILNGITDSELPEKMKGVLKDLWAMAQGNITVAQSEIGSFEKELENFYNNAMERATGWYKRKIRRILLVLGFCLAAVLNIDTIKITNDALNDEGRLAKTVDNIVSALPGLNANDSVKIKTGNNTIKVAQFTTPADSAVKKTLAKIKNLEITYNKQGGYQMGYEKGKYFNDWWADNNRLSVLLLKLLGLIITAFALQLGSNYWFDLLNKAVNLRATGKKPDQKKSN